MIMASLPTDDQVSQCYGGVRCGTLECGYGATAIAFAARCGVAQCGAVRCGTVWCGAIQRNATYANANYERVRQFGMLCKWWWFVNDRMECGMNGRRGFV